MEPNPSTTDPVPPRRGHGCFFGCAVVLLLILAVGGGGIGYVAWNLYRAVHSDPQMIAVLDSVRADPRAAGVIGRGAQVMQIERRSFPLSGKRGQAVTYRLLLVGPAGESLVEARLEPLGEGKAIVALKLTGPEGQVIWLMGPKAHGGETI